MATMTAITTDAAGEMKAETVPRPTPGPGEVLIRVAAAGVNPIDWKTRKGQGNSGAFADGETMILGWDTAGEIVEVGDGVGSFAVGDRVFGMPHFPRRADAYAEYVVAPAQQIAAIPESVSYLQAGAAPLAALTAWQALVGIAKVTAGDRVLIHAASGGVGHLAVQIAKARGAEVWGTASAASHDALRELGLDHPIDYHRERFEDVAADMDAVIDLVGSGDNPARSVRSLRSGGHLVIVPSSGTVPDQGLLDEAGVTVHRMLVEPDADALASIAAMMASGTLTVMVADTRPLAQMAELHALGEAGTRIGKLVATVDC